MAEGKSLLPKGSSGSSSSSRRRASIIDTYDVSAIVDEEQLSLWEQFTHHFFMYETNEVVRLHWHHKIYDTDQGREYKWAVRASILSYFAVSGVSDGRRSG